MKRHDFDAASFFTGLFITAIGLLYLIPDSPSDIWGSLQRVGNWLWPALLLVIGIAVLIPALIPKKDRDPTQSEPR